MEGVPTTANRWLLKEVLKEEWGWKGILVTDWDNVGRMVAEQKICANMAEAAALAIQSGNDLMMTTPGFFEGAQEAVALGMVSEPEIDEVVARILALKFRLGLFENPGRPDEARQREVIGCAAPVEFNREVARQSLVLLQNNGILPLASAPARTIAVIGPNADDPRAQLGDWAGNSGQAEWLMDGHPREMITTVMDGIRAQAPAGWQVLHAKGCDITVMTEAAEGSYDDGQPRADAERPAPVDLRMIAEAVKVAEQADIIVAVIGDTIPLIGEYRSTATLELQGGQLALLEALGRTSKPLIVVLINSKPLVLPESVTKAAAILELFNPGMCGGHGAAEAIFGHFNPSGKLTISFPRHVGQQPVFYSQVRGQHGDRYADLTQEPLFVFGEGLSYTRYEYANLRVLTSEIRLDGTVEVEVDVSNVGQRAGTEIVQLYTSDLVTSATWVNRELKACRRVTLQAGESATVRFSVPARELSIVNAAGGRVVEPGEFEVLVGPSSRDGQLLRTRFFIRAY